MRLQYITDEGIGYLKGNIKNHISFYQNGDKEYFGKILLDNKYLQDTGYNIDNFADRLRVSGNDKEDDVINAKILYEALKDIPPYMAAEESFWTALTHTLLFDFVYKKRGEGFKNTEKSLEYKEKAIKNAFFTYMQGKRRGMFVNCISSLWWGAHTVYDEKSRNPYHLLKEIALTGYPSTVMLMSSSSIMGRNETSVGFFLVIEALRAEGIKLSRQDIVEGIKYLNLVAGLNLIDLKSRTEISDMTYKFYNKYLNL